jgi:hypothetical protein
VKRPKVISTNEVQEIINLRKQVEYLKSQLDDDSAASANSQTESSDDEDPEELARMREIAKKKGNK